MTEPDKFHYFTPLFRELAKACGRDVALKLAESLGGRRHYIPRRPTEKFINAVGEAGAKWLSENYGGEDLDIPLGPANRNAKTLELIESLAGHKTTTQIAAKTGLTPHAVRRHLARIRGE